MTQARFALVLLLALAGCGGGSSPGSDAGGGGTDTGGAATDTGGGGTDTGSGSTDTGSGGGDVAACQAAVDAVIAACQAEGGNTQRECLYANYRDACSTGRTSVVTAMMSCLMMDACQSLADPSAATACVQGVVSANQTSAHQALGTAVCTCEPAPAETGCPTFPQYSGAELIIASEADATTVATCLGTTAGCADPNTCYAMIPYGAAFLACVGP